MMVGDDELFSTSRMHIQSRNAKKYQTQRPPRSASPVEDDEDADGEA